MRLIRHGHSCVRIEAEGRVLVIDPGIFSDAAALDGVDEVLVTHEHPDHMDIEKLTAAREKNSAFRVYLPQAAADQAAAALGDAAIVVAAGQRFSVAGFDVAAVGGQHAEIYDGFPGCANVGFIVDGAVYHPGDSLFVPETQVSTLLVPAAAPWLKLAEALDFVQAVKPQQAFPIHDATLNDLGKEYFAGWVESYSGGAQYTHLSAGESAEV
jgi:L-ascorbate metabolism protein UlaG (beta-lactamase superfamily)